MARFVLQGLMWDAWSDKWLPSHDEQYPVAVERLQQACLLHTGKEDVFDQGRTVNLYDAVFYNCLMRNSAFRKQCEGFCRMLASAIAAGREVMRFEGNAVHAPAPDPSSPSQMPRIAAHRSPINIDASLQCQPDTILLDQVKAEFMPQNHVAV